MPNDPTNAASAARLPVLQEQPVPALRHVLRESAQERLESCGFKQMDFGSWWQCSGRRGSL